MQKGILAAAVCLALSACGGSNSSNVESVEGTAFELFSNSVDSYFTLADIAPSEQTSSNVATLYYTTSITVSFDTDGYLRTPQNYYVLSVPANADGSVDSEALASAQAVQVDFDGDSTAQATSIIEAEFSLPADSSAIGVPFVETDDCGFESDSYTATDRIYAYDSLGESHNVDLFFAKVSDDTFTWEVRALIDCVELTPVEAQVLDFNESGELDIDDADYDGSVTSGGGLLEYEGVLFDNGSDELFLSLDLSESIALFGVFELIELEQDGVQFNQYDSMDIESNGLIRLHAYGAERYVSQLLMAGFQYPEDLTEVSEGVWMRTGDSGQFHHVAGGDIQPVTYSE
ncbi:hypothetical protein K0504_11980 [Neiella marina]|uniref:Flagellar hook protein FlgE D2 domain-containing protein n=1 Tax=Neiella holothuriorum TaxID=2870530 RepID=A0ABS7EHF2_9GAMM|nr:flagellar basal body FlgE domain-containing protein [Neiella holothuriorum]MBW8191755.1 hypothetical protein [Neiella holothuriorum]